MIERYVKEMCLATALRSAMASSPAAYLFFIFLLFGICCQQRVAAWSPSASSPVHLHSSQRASTSKLHVNSIEEDQQLLSSAYDRNLPAALVGEAVRSALRSDRGICFDFTTDRYAINEHNKCKLLSVIGVKGDGTESFINAKFSRSIPNHKVTTGKSTATSTLVRKGHSFETSYLSPKGRIIDRLLVLSFPSDDKKGSEDEALIITSPGNSGNNLYTQLSSLVFPMDKVVLTDFAKPLEEELLATKTNVITLACSSVDDAQHSFRTNILDLLQVPPGEFEFPPSGVCHHYSVAGGAVDAYITEHTFLSPEICRGYTIVFQEDSSSPSTPLIAEQVWQKLTDELNDRGPVGVGSLEYNTLRVEGGWAGYGYEMTGDGPKKQSQLEATIKEKLAKRRSQIGANDNPQESHEFSHQEDDEDNNADETYYAKASPLELHLQHLVDTEKGCYQGQEGVASLLKNKRGLPRQLYQVVFYDSENEFDDDFGSAFSLINTVNDEALRSFQQMQREADPLSNDTRQPREGDKLFVLGSSESIQVGTITSVAEPNGNGDRTTIALAMVRRPGPILKAMKETGLDLPRWWEDDIEDDEDGGSAQRNIAMQDDGSGIMMPPPLDALVNLEVVLEGTYTVGRLKSIPSRRMKSSSKSSDVAALLDYERRGEVVDPSGPGVFKYEFQDEEIESSTMMDKDQSSSPVTVTDNDIDEGFEDDEDIITEEQILEAEKEAAAAEAAAIEAKRKAEKMAQLKARAEAAMAARRKKKQQ